MKSTKPRNSVHWHYFCGWRWLHYWATIEPFQHTHTLQPTTEPCFHTEQVNIYKWKITYQQYRCEKWHCSWRSRQLQSSTTIQQFQCVCFSQTQSEHCILPKKTIITMQARLTRKALTLLCFDIFSFYAHGCFAKNHQKNIDKEAQQNWAKHENSVLDAMLFAIEQTVFLASIFAPTDNRNSHTFKFPKKADEIKGVFPAWSQ